LLAAALIAAASMLLLYRNYRTEAQAHRQVMLERGRTVLDSLAAGIRAHGRMGRYHGERLAAIFEELAATPGILALELRTREGSIIASAGDMGLLPEGPLATPCWLESRLVMATEPELTCPAPGSGRRRGGGGRGAQDLAQWIPFPAGPYRLSVVLDAAPMRRQLRRDQLQLAIACAVAVGAILLGTWVLLARLRQRSLQAALGLAQERATHHERLSQLGAGLAHETKNPLGIVRGLAQTISNAAHADRETKRVAHNIIDEVDRTAGRINSFLALAKPKAPDLAPVDLDAFLGHLLSVVEPELEASGITLEHAQTGYRVLADEDLLRRGVLNLVINALRASHEGGTITVEVQPEADTVTLSVVDNGCGIDPQDLPRATEPYFTRFEGGCGLGLAIVDQIARAHNWKLTIASPPGAGTRVSLHGLRRVG